MKNVISRDELLKTHQSLCEKAQDLMKAKNHDYAHEADVFRNFRYFGSLGILVRLSDKLARLRSFEENGSFAVADEKLMDTILDTINYAVIYYAYRQEGQAPVEIKDGPYCDFCNALAAAKNTSTGKHYCERCQEQSVYPDGVFTCMERA